MSILFTLADPRPASPSGLHTLSAPSASSSNLSIRMPVG